METEADPPTRTPPAAPDAGPDRPGRMGRTEKLWAVLVSVGLSVLVAVPGVRMMTEDDPADGYPISTYPMFSRDRGRVVDVATVVAVDPDGSVSRLSPQEIAGTDQVIQASGVVRRAVAAGDAAAQALCARVAGRVSAPAEIAVVVERYDSIRWAADRRAGLIHRREVATCPAHG